MNEKDQILYEQEFNKVVGDKKLRRELGIYLKPRVLHPKIGRNEPCPCGSGKKYKKCCKDGNEQNVY